MKAQFWLNKWEESTTLWDKDEPNQHFRQYLNLYKPGTIFFPLCGKSIDMLYAYENGYSVLGNDISPIAIKKFFEVFNIDYKETEFGCASIDGKIKLYNLNLFTDNKKFHNDLSTISGVFDRGSLIALTPRQRKNYYNFMNKCIPKGAISLIVGCDYNAELFSPPPHNVPRREVREGFGKHFSINILKRFNEMAHFRDTILPVERAVYLLKKVN